MVLIKFGLFLLVCAALILLALAGHTGQGISTAVNDVHISQIDAVDSMLYPASEDELWAGRELVIRAPEVEITSDHADLYHDEAEYVRQTCKQRGVYQVWREKYDKKTYHLLCMTVDGRLVDWVVKVVGGKVIEKTAFMPRDGAFKQVIDYVMGKATRFNQPGW